MVTEHITRYFKNSKQAEWQGSEWFGKRKVWTVLCSNRVLTSNAAGIYIDIIKKEGEGDASQSERENNGRVAECP